MNLDFKDPEEIVTITFDFTRDLGAEAIAAASQVVTIAVVSGADPNVGQVPNGAPQISGTKVLQSIKQGVHLVDYSTRCRIDTSGGRRLVLAALLPVRSA